MGVSDTTTDPHRRSAGDPGAPSRRVDLIEVARALGALEPRARGRADGLYVRAVKPLLDRLAALGMFVVLAMPGAILVGLIKLDSPGPAFYRQTRVGRNARPFSMLKFRSMVVGAETTGAGLRVERNDARITRMGRFLRATSLDELPQLLNVLGGDMSFIGPRPGLTFQAEQYTPEQRRRLLVSPGITGWAQVHGRNAIGWDERIRYDLEYVDRASGGLDLGILLKTVEVVVRGADQVAGTSHFRPQEGDGFTDGDAEAEGEAPDAAAGRHIADDGRPAGETGNEPTGAGS